MTPSSLTFESSWVSKAGTTIEYTVATDFKLSNSWRCEASLKP